MQARLDLCKAKGFDGVDPDNVNAYLNDTGFPLTYEDQLVFNRWLAEEAHARGLAIGLKNDTEQTEDLLPYFNWVITESCFDQGWCEQAIPFVEAGKPVFAIKYTDTGIALADFCEAATAWNFSAILKNRDLDAYREDCSAAPQPADWQLNLLNTFAVTTDQDGGGARPEILSQDERFRIVYRDTLSE